ncbi:MAG: VWA domain-containing protein [Spirochaetaceae bacterium]|jgi:Mg-chelatase subunit ChlD|nr:VWA domain-containing protein [Spirochaetaceae bacterium]
MKPSFLFAACAGVFLCTFPLAAQDLSIGAADLRVTQGADGGFHLYIRKKPDVHAVLLSESVRDPAMREDNYAYRALEWNAVNGDEIRVMDGEVIPRDRNIWSLIDSTLEPHGEFGSAFHIYIPYIINYGYPWTRNGEVYVGNGTYFNIRAFEKPYGDYSGAFRDNSFLLEVNQSPLAGPPVGNYMRDTVDAFNEIAEAGRGEAVRSIGPADIITTIGSILRKERGDTLDLVFALDTTASMRDDITEIRKNLANLLAEETRGFRSFQVGMVLYKDYGDTYITKTVPFTSDLNKFQRSLLGITTGGGRDIPEAVYEALYEASRFRWQAESRLVILIGDAPPHPRPRGRVTKETAAQALDAQQVKVSVIILPQ